MDKTVLNDKECGEITVFLTFVLIIIMSLTGTLIESARVSVLRNYSERNLRLSAESLFTEYCRPLWEDYHLFMLEGEAENKDRLAEKAKKYMGSITGSLYEEIESAISVEDITYFTEYEGELYLNEMAEYMKFHFPEVLFDIDKDGFKHMEAVEEETQVMIQQLEVDEKLASLNQSVLKILSLIEGITVVGGKFKVRGSFVKQLCPGDVTPSFVGVECSDLWNKLKHKYIRWNEAGAGKCRQLIKVIDQAAGEIDKLEERVAKLSKEIPDFSEVYKPGKEEKIIQMKPVLLSNKRVLENYLESLEMLEEDENGAENPNEILKQYDIYSLRFDYTDLAVKQQENPFEKIKNNLHTSLLKMTAEDYSEISKKKIPADSKIIDTKKNSSFSQEYTDTLKSYEIKEGADITEGFKMYSEGISLKHTFQTALELAYYQEHFENFRTAPVKDKGKVCLYEQEFLAAGGRTDMEALERIADRILLIRTMFNYVYLLTDKVKSEEAFLAAAALVGFTGMEPLINLVKHVILIYWSAAEAMVDVGVLLRGHEIPLWKSNQTFQVQFNELFIFGRALIQEKADKYNIPFTLGTQSYEDYLRIFLFFEPKENRLNRSLHLIQENMRLRYYDDFSIADGIFGIKLSGCWEYRGRRIFKRDINYSY